VKAYEVPLGNRQSKGNPLPQVLPITGNEGITSVIPITDFGEEDFLLLLTEHGFVKKTSLKAFRNINARGLTAIALGPDDSLRWARKCKSEQDILIATQ
jgi:DNA gyrase subunit A